MDLQKKFDIALKLLESGLSRDDICFCSSDTLASIANTRLGIDEIELEIFAEAVFHRRYHRARRKQAESHRRSEITILVTDDDLCLTERMIGFARISQDLSDQISVLDSGVTTVFRIRDAALAQRCSLILNRDVQATTEPLPSLKIGDCVCISINLTTSKNSIIGSKSII